MVVERRGLSCLFALTATLVTAGAALAGPQDYYWTTINDGSALARIDKTSGASTTYASHGYNYARSVVWSGGSLWTQYYSGSSQWRLGQFNTTDGTITSIASISWDYYGLEVSSGGTMYTTGPNGLEASLYTINQTTGAATWVGDMGIGWFNDMYDTAFDSSGTLWGVDKNDHKLWTINTSTGAAALAATITGVGAYEFGIAFDETDTLYLTTWEANTRLFTVNTGSGAATLVGYTGVSNSYGGDFEPQSIPLPPAMLLGLIGLGGVVIVRRRFTA